MEPQPGKKFSFGLGYGGYKNKEAFVPRLDGHVNDIFTGLSIHSSSIAN
jgi:hypothetical protein